MSAEVDTAHASIARVYDASLGGKDNFEADRKALEYIRTTAPDISNMTLANRRWLARVIGYLADRRGVEQFLDVGSGLPTVQNTHEVAQRWNPEARVVYIDNDPAVNAYGRALLEENRQTRFGEADMLDPDSVFNARETRMLDMERPIVLMHCATTPHMPDEVDPWAIMRRYVELLPSGSYLALTAPWNEADGSDTANHAGRVEATFLSSGMGSGRFRTKAEITAFFDGMELLEPGVVPINEWWPAGPPVGDPGIERLGLGGVARKP